MRTSLTRRSWSGCSPSTSRGLASDRPAPSSKPWNPAAMRRLRVGSMGSPDLRRRTLPTTRHPPRRTPPTSPERVSGGVPSSSGFGAWKRRPSAGAPPRGRCQKMLARLEGAAVFRRVRRLRRWRGRQGPSCAFLGHRGAKCTIPAGFGTGRLNQLVAARIERKECPGTYRRDRRRAVLRLLYSCGRTASAVLLPDSPTRSL
jgi:hypothetical protein